MTKRTMSMTLTVHMTLDLVPGDKEGETNLNLNSAQYNVLGHIVKADDEDDLSDDFKQAIGVEAAKMASQYVLDKMNGKPPVNVDPNQPMAMA